MKKLREFRNLFSINLSRLLPYKIQVSFKRKKSIETSVLSQNMNTNTSRIKKKAKPPAEKKEKGAENGKVRRKDRKQKN